MKFFLSDKSKKSLALMLVVSVLTLLSLSIAIGLDLSPITTTTTTGLVTDYLDYLYADDEYIIAGGHTAGLSYIKASDLSNPRGKVINYRGRASSNAIAQMGLQGFTKRNSDGIIYAWYGNDIVDVINKKIVYNNAPDWNHGWYSCVPKDRFVTDSAGNFWIGTVNLDETGNNKNVASNGLFKINADFSGKTTILTDAIWNLFKDSFGVIWIVSNKGIYKRDEGSNPVLVFDSQSSSPTRWAEQVIEHDGKIYAIMKNFFHYPGAMGVLIKSFELYQWNGTTFIKVCDVQSGNFNTSAHAFVYGGSLYINIGGTYLFNAGSGSVSLVSDIGSKMGSKRLTAVGNALVSVGNISGISIYNWGASGQTIRITAANTAEGLISDNIQSLYFSQTTNRLLIGPTLTEGFNIFANNTFDIYNFPNTSTSTVGFFEHGGKLYIQGGNVLYYMNASELVEVKYFPTNTEKIYYDSRGYVWSFPNWGAGFGGIGVLNLLDLTIKGMKDSFGNNYWSAVETWTLDQGYHFYDVVSVPGENAVFIAVGDSEIASPYVKMPFVLKYNYTTNAFSKVFLPDTDCEGIRKFASDGTYLYGISRQRLYRYLNGAWEYYCPIKLGNDFRGAAIAEDYLFIISGWNSNGGGLSGGLEVVDLLTKTSSHYNSSVIPLPTDAVFAITIQQTGDHAYRLWLGTFKGLAYCDLSNI
jgi:hypothetical protein